MHIPRHLLPSSLARIADYCGDEIMWLLWEHYGGGHVVVPKHPAPEHHLCQSIGHPQALKLSASFGGEMLRIPCAHNARLAARNELIRHDYSNGMTQHQLARRYHLTERQIGHICRPHREPEQITLDLFVSMS